MQTKKRHWLWNTLIVLAVAVCVIAFVAHYKNWVAVEKDHLKILSGIYYKKVPFKEMVSVTMVEKIPQMERVNGFSAWEREKGIFKDSLYPESRVYVYVDNLAHPKIKLTHQDSLALFMNLSDSLKTLEMFELLSFKIDSARTQFSEQK